MKSLQEKLNQTDDFLIGVELVSVRGSMAAASAIKARTFSQDLVNETAIDWISITDNAGGNPQMAPYSLGKPILYAGKEVVIHLTCKDLNRNGLESEAWSLNSEGFHNILAMTGDFPIAGNEGHAKPVFDIDSVGLISMLDKMNKGFDHTGNGERSRKKRFEETCFNIGAVTSNFKLREGEVIPQYLKLQKKIEAGANFIINQIGYDARKISEQILYMQRHEMGDTPLIGNVYLLNGFVAKLFNSKKIPGVVVSDELRDLCIKHAETPDKGNSFFQELAAKQIAIYKGLGYRGAYIGGAHSASIVKNILKIEKTFAPDDWKIFAKEISYSRDGEFFFYPEKADTGLSDVKADPLPRTEATQSSISYSFSKWIHDIMFMEGKPLSNWGTHICSGAKDPKQGPRPMRLIEHISKSTMFGCKDCGDCSLPDIAFLCPESQCAKNQRNGPCGGTRDGRCEVDGYDDCIWLRAYNLVKSDGKELNLLNHAPMIQDQLLRGTSAWSNSWLKKDHAAKKDTNALSHNDQVL